MTHDDDKEMMMLSTCSLPSCHRIAKIINGYIAWYIVQANQNLTKPNQEMWLMWCELCVARVCQKDRWIKMR